jgi:Na+/melibiose symporter-like transporter
VFLMNLPVLALALVAVLVLLPESRSPERPALDPVGIVTSSAGLAVLTFGLVKAGQDGWGSAGALAGILGGLAVLVAFVLWERTRGNRALVDMRLFADRRFTWGTIIGGLGIFAFFGIMFAAPQYFQAVLGTDAMGSGIRLLPLLGGMMVGAGAADRIAAKAGAKVTVTLGFVILAGGLVLASATTGTSGYGLAATWTALGGLGAGLALATASSATLSTISTDRAGTASALMQAVQKLGSPLSAAILGSVLNAGYSGHLTLTGLPAQAADAVRDSVFAGVAVADQLGSAALLAEVRAAFVAGLDQLVWVAAAIAVAGAVVTLLFLPARATRVAGTEPEPAQSGHDVVVR